MSAIGPGDFVEYSDSHGAGTLPAGTVARVEGLNQVCKCITCGVKGPGLILSIPHPVYGVWSDCVWRPIYRPKSSFIEGLLQPAPGEQVPA